MQAAHHYVGADLVNMIAGAQLGAVDLYPFHFDESAHLHGRVGWDSHIIMHVCSQPRNAEPHCQINSGTGSPSRASHVALHQH